MTYHCHPLLSKTYSTQVHEWEIKDTLYLTERETEKGNFQDSSLVASKLEW